MLPQMGPLAHYPCDVARFAHQAEELGADGLLAGDRLLAPVKLTVGYGGGRTIPGPFMRVLDPLPPGSRCYLYQADPDWNKCPQCLVVSAARPRLASCAGRFGGFEPGSPSVTMAPWGCQPANSRRHARTADGRRNGRWPHWVLHNEQPLAGTC